ncbi:MAG: molybdopterin-dependent oxidoreductase [Desulfomonilaceae bacterium]
MTQIIINGIEISAAEGMTVLEAAKQAGIWIPTLCYHPKISPSDSCRMCVVEVDGVGRPVTSCNTIVAEGMQVRTDTPVLRHIRDQVMKLVLMDHPLECPTCPAAGECEIQNLTYRLNVYGSEYPVEKRSLPVVRDWPLIEYNPNLCITCLRCVKVCHEVIGASALALKDVGYEARIDTADGKQLNCDFCGECVEACPSGAMATKVSKRWARSWQLRKTPTICPLCSAGCRIEMNVKDNSIFRITTDIDSHNKGSLCVGGRFAYDLIEHEDRLLTPLLRDGDELKPASWEEAIAFTAGKLKKIIDISGPESVAGLISPRLTNEDCYAFQKFLRGIIGTNNIDSEARFSFLRVQRALELTCGVHGTNGTLEELLDSSALLIIGIDPLEETPALAWKIKAAARQYDSNVIVANSRMTSIDRFARIRLPIRPYAESDLLLGIMKIILDLELWDTKFVRDQTTNFLSLKKLLDKISLKGILRRTGVTQEALEETARIFAEASSAAIIFGGDVILQEDGLQCIMNIVNLALLTGNVGPTKTGIYPIFEKGNIVGLCDMGNMPEYLPGYQDTARVRDLFHRVWDTDLPYGRGKTVTEIARGLETGEVKALFIAGADPLTDYPHSGRYASAFEKAELLIVQDIFLSPTARKAHCVFPAASFAEKDGTMTNIEHRIQKLNQVIQPLGESRPDWSIFEDIAKAMGRSMGYFKAEDIFADMTATIPFYKGLRLTDLPSDGSIRHPFSLETGPVRSGKPYSFAPIRTAEAPEPADAAEYPLEMMAGRSMFHFGSVTTRSKNLLDLCPKGYIEISRKDAEQLGLIDGESLEVLSPNGSFIGPAKISEGISAGMIFVPSNFPDMAVYKLFRENTTVCRVKLNRPG